MRGEWFDVSTLICLSLAVTFGGADRSEDNAGRLAIILIKLGAKIAEPGEDKGGIRSQRTNKSVFMYSNASISRARDAFNVKSGF